MRLAVVGLLTAAISCASGGRPNDEASRVVTGVVVEIESLGLDEVESFTVKDGDRRYTIVVDEGTDFAFTPSHLNQHRATGEPVRVDVASRDGALHAISVDDA